MLVAVQTLITLMEVAALWHDDRQLLQVHAVEAAVLLQIMLVAVQMTMLVAVQMTIMTMQVLLLVEGQ